MRRALELSSGKQTNLAGAAEYTAGKKTFKQKYGYNGSADKLLRLAKEILQALEGAKESED